MFLVRWLPDPPNQIRIHIKNKIKPLTRPPFSLIWFSHSLSSITQSQLTTSPAHPLFLPPSLSAFSLSFIVTATSSSPAQSKLSLLSLSTFAWGRTRRHDSQLSPSLSSSQQPLLHRHGLNSLFSLSAFAWGRTRHHGVVPDQVRPHQIW
jgi:hypothetical protein